MAHILVVDDERSICELLEITFRKEGHRVEVALNGESARRKLSSQIFDIVISDIRMPDTTGVELLQFCKEISPSSYFLLITGVPTVETAIAAINAGADRYVIKDHDLVDQLRRAVRSRTMTSSINCAARCARLMKPCTSKAKPATCGGNCGASRARTISSAIPRRCAQSLT